MAHGELGGKSHLTYSVLVKSCTIDARFALNSLVNSGIIEGMDDKEQNTEKLL